MKKYSVMFMVEIDGRGQSIAVHDFEDHHSAVLAVIAFTAWAGRPTERTILIDHIFLYDAVEAEGRPIIEPLGS